ncbi:hypothetical protein GXP74_20165 [Streptacidiphilus sp. P02-A3a]|nr:hypothetical protein GXP74_20165 [Streptacidiphilus sp. P02-A3a]
MHGFTAATPLPYDRAPQAAHATRSAHDTHLRLPADRSHRLYTFAKNARLTVNTVVQGAWALLLAAHSGERDVCFGATVSGRPENLAGADEIIGLFINTLPVRTTLDRDLDLVTWLRRIQDEQVETRQFEHVSLAQVRGWSETPRESNLFDSIVIFESFPYDRDAASRHGLTVRESNGAEETNYALALTAYTTDELHLRLGYDPLLFDRDTAERLTRRLSTLLDAFADHPHSPLASLPLLPGHRTGPAARVERHHPPHRDNPPPSNCSNNRPRPPPEHRTGAPRHPQLRRTGHPRQPGSAHHLDRPGPGPPRRSPPWPAHAPPTS